MIQMQHSTANAGICKQYAIFSLCCASFCIFLCYCVFIVHAAFVRIKSMIMMIIIMQEVLLKSVTAKLYKVATAHLEGLWYGHGNSHCTVIAVLTTHSLGMFDRPSRYYRATCESSSAQVSNSYYIRSRHAVKSI